jgi:EpsI family protein
MTFLRPAIIAILMIAAPVGAHLVRPSQRVADMGPRIDLEAIVPKEFANWREETRQAAPVVNPERQAHLDQLYSQILTRTYVDSNGYRIMLSIAYGGNQSDSLQVHLPDTCYPAQGFQLWGKTTGKMSTPFGEIPIQRIFTVLDQRREPVTYWITVGDRSVEPNIQKKLVELSYRLTGKIPDGLLFRVSSIDADEQSAYAVQDRFIGQLLEAAGPDARKHLAGLGS